MKNKKINQIIDLVSKEINENAIRKIHYYDSLKINKFANIEYIDNVITYQENELNLLKVIKKLMLIK